CRSAWCWAFRSVLVARASGSVCAQGLRPSPYCSSRAGLPEEGSSPSRFDAAALGLVDQHVGHLHADDGAGAQMFRHPVRVVAEGEVAAQPVELPRLAPPGKSELAGYLVRIDRRFRRFSFRALAGEDAVGRMYRILREADAAGMKFVDNRKIIDRGQMSAIGLRRLFRQELVQ